MKARRAPDRVHVVRPPQQEDHNLEIVRALTKITDKLKRSEAERHELLSELREYRRALSDIEDKTSQTEKAYLGLENKIKSREQIDEEITRRQTRFEKSLKEAEDRMVKAVAGHALIDQRLKDTEAGQAAVNQRLDESLAQQARMDRQIEKVGQDKSRMLRKVERLEEIVVETKDTLQAKAMVLLTDQSVAAQKALPPGDIWGETPRDGDQAPWWQKLFPLQSAGMAVMIVAALMAGWMINQAQRPQVPQIAVLDSSQIARLGLDESGWEPVVLNNVAVPSPTLAELEGGADGRDVDLAGLASENTTSRIPNNSDQGGDQQTDTDTLSAESPPGAAQTGATETEAARAEAAQAERTESGSSAGPSDSAPQTAPLDYSDDRQLIAALEKDPQELAGDLNRIAPTVGKALETADPGAAGSVEAGMVIRPAAKGPATDTKTQNAKTADDSFTAREIRAQDRQDVPQRPATSQPAAATDTTGPDNLAATALAQDPALKREIAGARADTPLLERATVDKNLPAMIKDVERQAFAGNAEAQHDLAAIYTAGHGGVEQDFAKAAFWFREAAESGIANARYNLAVLYHQGLGVARDLNYALYWYREAAALNHPEALYNLGIAYVEGIGTDYDPAIAAEFFRLAAGNGVMEAAYNLGLIYENGLLGQPQPEEALYWYKMAADKGSPEAKTAMEQLARAQQIGLEDINALTERLDGINTR